MTTVVGDEGRSREDDVALVLDVSVHLEDPRLRVHGPLVGQFGDVAALLGSNGGLVQVVVVRRRDLPALEPGEQQMPECRPPATLAVALDTAAATPRPSAVPRSASRSCA